MIDILTLELSTARMSQDTLEAWTEAPNVTRTLIENWNWKYN